MDSLNLLGNGVQIKMCDESVQGIAGPEGISRFACLSLPYLLRKQK